ncbi:hypothetical protein H0H93_007996 [Arthromyces matolae]|nr:hypothetical protein H0H93_007996 [Arthromyces matolae]
MPRKTRSGITFSPFTYEPIENPTFDLGEAIKEAIVTLDERLEDDVHLSSTPIDQDALHFWASESSADLPQSQCAPPVLDPSQAGSVRSVDNEVHSRIDTFQGPNARGHAKRAKKQALKAQTLGLGFHAPRNKTIKTHVEDASAVNTQLNVEALPADSSGYIGKSKRPGKGVYFNSLQALLDDGYQLIEWNGYDAKPLRCKEGRIFAVLVGQPKNTSYAESQQRAFEAIMKEGKHSGFTDEESIHCRGNFPAVNVGSTLGFGALYPTNLSGGAHAQMIERLLKNPDVMRMANFADGALNLFAPRLYKHISDHLTPLFQRLSYLRKLFQKSIFPCAAFNFGGRVVTKSHRDCMNAAIGWCAIHALGSFDPKKGGHLVLPDLKLVIEFPPGALILIPSATLVHGNLPIGEGEQRVSFTLYCGGGLLRYVTNGFRTESQLRKEDPKEYARICALKATHWKEDLKLYSTVEELRSFH